MKKILVAEDERSIREFITINLSLAGYNIVEAQDGLQAIEKSFLSLIKTPFSFIRL